MCVTISSMVNAAQLTEMSADELRVFAVSLLGEISDVRRDNVYKQTKIDQLTHEMALLKRHRFGKAAEHMKGEQRQLFDETVEADLEAMTQELKGLQSEATATPPKDSPKRAPLPATLPRREVRHEPETTVCRCGCQLTRIGEDVSEKLDYTPGVFSVERHVRGKWVCRACETLVQAPVPPHVIDKGVPTAGLLAHVLVAKYIDHLPLYRQEQIFGRAGLEIPRSTLAQWVGRCGVAVQPLTDALREAMFACPVLHADETPVAMLAPGAGKTHRAYVWAYGTTQYAPLKAVVYDFAESRAGKHARRFLDGWRGKLVCDDFAGYKALFANDLTEVGCTAHARRKFHELWVSQQSPIAEEGLEFYRRLYDIERTAQTLDADERRRLRQRETQPVLDALHRWLLLQRQKATDGTALARALDYSLKRWAALVRFADDGDLPIDNNHLENRIRPIALGRSNWLFAGSLRGGQRAAAVMSLVQSAKLNGHDPHAYLQDVLARLPTQPASRITELLPHRWQPA